MFGTAATYVSLILEAKDLIDFAGKLPVFTGGLEHRPKEPKLTSKPASRKAKQRRFLNVRFRAAIGCRADTPNL